MSTDPEKTKAVSEWPVPKNVKEVRSFLGLCSYYRKFIFHFANIARPLHKLTEKNQSFVWTEECQMAFENLKQALPQFLLIPEMRILLSLIQMQVIHAWVQYYLRSKMEKRKL